MFNYCCVETSATQRSAKKINHQQEAGTNGSQVVVFEGHMSWQLIRAWRKRLTCHTMPQCGLIYACLINTLVRGKPSVSRKLFWSLFVLFFADKRDRCLFCRRVEECVNRRCHFVSLYPLSYWFPLKKARTIFTGKAKLHYLLVLCYLEVGEVKKTAGLWWNGATLKPKKPRVFDHLTWSSYIQQQDPRNKLGNGLHLLWWSEHCLCTCTSAEKRKNFIM